MSRFVALAAAMALVVSGVVIGALSTFLLFERPRMHDGMRPPPPMPPPPQQGPFTREMEFRLDLSEEQRKQIQTVLHEGREQSEAIRRELRPRLEAHLTATRARIAALLMPEQRVKFEQLVEEDKRRAERFFIESPPGPPRDGPPPPPPPFP